MNTNKVLIGTIKRGESIVGDYVFLKVSNYYILLEDAMSLLDYLKYKLTFKRSMLNIPKFNTLYNDNEYYIDTFSLKPYYLNESNKSLKRIKEDYKNNVNI